MISKVSLMLLIILLVGCGSVPRSYQPVADFQKRNPGEYSRYAYLNPVSLDTYRALWGERAGATNFILEEMQRRFGSNDGVKEFVKKTLQQEGKDRQRILALFRNLEELSTGGGAVCQYEWSDGKTREVGFLVLKLGEVVKREPWVTDYISDREEK